MNTSIRTTVDRHGSVDEHTCIGMKGCLVWTLVVHTLEDVDLACVARVVDASER